MGKKIRLNMINMSLKLIVRTIGVYLKPLQVLLPVAVLLSCMHVKAGSAVLKLMVCLAVSAPPPLASKTASHSSNKTEKI